MEKFTNQIPDENTESNEKAENIKTPSDFRRKMRKLFAGFGIGVAGILPMKDIHAQNVTENADISKKFPPREVMTDATKIKETLTSLDSLYEANPDSVSGAFKDAYTKYDEQREWLKQNVNSPEYKKRLLENEWLTENDFEERKKQIADGDFVVEQDPSKSFSTEGFSAEQAGAVQAYYNPNDNTVHLGVKDNGQPDAIHEFGHKVTTGGENMSIRAKSLYDESFDWKGLYGYTKEQVMTMLDTVTPDENVRIQAIINYATNPTERDVRKKILEYDMERLGVKKYGEKFTMDDYNKLINLMKAGKLSEDAVEFLKSTKPEMMEIIMSTIVFQESHTNESENVT